MSLPQPAHLIVFLFRMLTARLDWRVAEYSNGDSRGYTVLSIQPLQREGMDVAIESYAAAIRCRFDNNPGWSFLSGKGTFDINPLWTRVQPLQALWLSCNSRSREHQQVLAP